MNNNPSAKRSDAMKAALLSATVMPGAGQLYNRDWLKGALLIVVFLVASLALFVPLGYALALYYLELNQGNLAQSAKSLEFVRENTINFILLGIACLLMYVYSIIDAYRAK